MYSLVLVCLMGQVTDPVQRDREWLLAQLIADKGFRTAQLEVVQKRLERMTPSQIKEIVDNYKLQREQKRNELIYEQQIIYNQAVANLERAKAYRDYLAGQYRSAIGYKQKEVKLMRQQTENMNYNLSPQHPPYYYSQ